MVLLLLNMLYDYVLLLLLSNAAVHKLLSLALGLVKIFSKVTASSCDNKFNNEQGSKYETAIVPLLMLLFSAAVLFLYLFAASGQE